MIINIEDNLYDYVWDILMDGNYYPVTNNTFIDWFKENNCLVEMMGNNVYADSHSISINEEDYIFLTIKYL